MPVTKIGSKWINGNLLVFNSETKETILEIDSFTLRLLTDIKGEVEANKVRTTPEGGIAIKLINKTGAVSKKGTIVSASFTTDNAFNTSIADSVIPQGSVYESGVPDGQLCWVVVSGIAEVLLKNDTPAVRGNWVGMSDAAGRVSAGGGGHTGTNPPAQAEHNKEIGHCLESKEAGTDVLAKIIMHFN